MPESNPSVDQEQTLINSSTDASQSVSGDVAPPPNPEIELISRQDEVIAGLDELDAQILQAIEALAAERKLELKSLAAQENAANEDSERESDHLKISDAVEDETHGGEPDENQRRAA